MRIRMRMRLPAALAAVAFVTGAGIAPQAAAEAQRTTYTDPVAYCRAVVTIDAPDKRYRGAEAPPWIRRHVGARRGDLVVWRCASGGVLACVNRGITGPCDKYDLSRVPSADVREYCRVQRFEASIAAAVTGHSTVYDWGCRNGRPVINRQFQFPDAQGFMPSEWRVVQRRP